MLSLKNEFANDSTRVPRDSKEGMLSVTFLDQIQRGHRHSNIREAKKVKKQSMTLYLDAYVASELQRNKDTVRYGMLGAEVSGHRKEQLRQTLMVRL